MPKPFSRRKAVKHANELAYEARQDGAFEAFNDLILSGPAGLVLAEAFLASTDFLPDGMDPFVDGYRDRYYSITA